MPLRGVFSPRLFLMNSVTPSEASGGAFARLEAV